MRFTSLTRCLIIAVTLCCAGTALAADFCFKSTPTKKDLQGFNSKADFLRKAASNCNTVKYTYSIPYLAQGQDWMHYTKPTITSTQLSTNIQNMAGACDHVTKKTNDKLKEYPCNMYVKFMSMSPAQLFQEDSDHSFKLQTWLYDLFEGAVEPSLSSRSDKNVSSNPADIMPVSTGEQLR